MKLEGKAGESVTGMVETNGVMGSSEVGEVAIESSEP